MKLCKYCNKYYPESDFGVAKTIGKKVYRRLKCRFCYNETKRIIQDKYREWMVNYKKERGCMSCGIKDHRTLEFHHATTKNKDFTIAQAFYNHFSFDRIKKEIEKCKVICANCHRILHYGKVWRRRK